MTLDPFVLTDIELQAYKENNAVLEELYSWNFLDDKLKCVIPLLNKDPDIATVWSCEGHYKDGVTKGRNEAYIVFAVNQTGLIKLLTLTSIMQNLHHDWFNIRLSYTKRLSIKYKTTFDNKWILSLPYSKQIMKDHIFQCLEEQTKLLLGH